MAILDLSEVSWQGLGLSKRVLHLRSFLKGFQIRRPGFHKEYDIAHSLSTATPALFQHHLTTPFEKPFDLFTHVMPQTLNPK